MPQERFLREQLLNPSIGTGFLRAGIQAIEQGARKPSQIGQLSERLESMAIPTAIRQLSDTIWEIPTSHKPGMRVPARIYATPALLEGMDDGVF